MKKLICVFMILFFASCSNRAEKNMEFSPVDIDDYNDQIEDLEISRIESNSMRYINLSQDKLQEMYDLVALKQSHPEFKKTIESQLKNYTLDSLITIAKEESHIKNVKIKEKIIQVSDSVQKMKLYYDIVSVTSTKPDSIWAEVITNTLVIDGETKIANKIKFSFNK